MFAGIYAYGRCEHWKAMYEASADDLDNALERISKTEKSAQAIADKFKLMADIVQQQAERPIVAALSDDHVRMISSTLAQLVVANQGANRLN